MHPDKYIHLKIIKDFIHHVIMLKKDDLGLKSRCMPEGLTDTDGNCVVCGKESVTKIYFGKQY